MEKKQFSKKENNQMMLKQGITKLYVSLKMVILTQYINIVEITT